jgi:transcriptional regulator with XRE-family HTH domain
MMSRRAQPHAALTAVGEVLRERRRQMGISQEKLSVEAGYHRTYLGQLERGEVNPSLVTLVKLSAILGCKASELLTEAGY